MSARASWVALVAITSMAVLFPLLRHPESFRVENQPPALQSKLAQLTKENEELRTQLRDSGPAVVADLTLRCENAQKDKRQSDDRVKELDKENKEMHETISKFSPEELARLTKERDDAITAKLASVEAGGRAMKQLAAVEKEGQRAVAQFSATLLCLAVKKEMGYAEYVGLFPKAGTPRFVLDMDEFKGGLLFFVKQSQAAPAALDFTASDFEGLDSRPYVSQAMYDGFKARWHRK